MRRAWGALVLGVAVILGALPARADGPPPRLLEAKVTAITPVRVEEAEPALLERSTESLVLATDHEVELTGLRPGTRIGYRILGNGEVRSPTFTFWTLPRTGSSGFDVAVCSAGQSASTSVRRTEAIMPRNHGASVVACVSRWIRVCLLAPSRV